MANRVIDKYTISTIQYIIHECHYHTPVRNKSKYLYKKLKEIYDIVEEVRVRDRGEGNVELRDRLNAELKEGRKDLSLMRPVMRIYEGMETKFSMEYEGEYYIYIPLEEKKDE